MTSNEETKKTVFTVLAIAFVVVFVIPTVLGFYLLMHDGSVTRNRYKVQPSTEPAASPGSPAPRAP
jgi:hypothetical protein